MDNRELYHADFYEWAQRTAELIRQERSGEVDRERLAEEIADMGREPARDALADNRAAPTPAQVGMPAGTAR